MQSMVGQNFRMSSIIKKYVILVESQSNNNLQIIFIFSFQIYRHIETIVFFGSCLFQKLPAIVALSIEGRKSRETEREREREEEDGRLSRAHAEIDARSRTNTKAKECHSRRLGRFPTLPSGIP